MLNTEVTKEKINLVTLPEIAPSVKPEVLDFVKLQKINRGPKPTKKASDFDLVVLRHSDLRKVSNPPPEELEKYKSVIETAINKFHRINYNLMIDNVMDVDDLRSYAQMWTVNFIGLWENKDKDLEENKKILMNNLKQRLLDFKRALKKKNLNEFVSKDNPFINQMERQLTPKNSPVVYEPLTGKNSGYKAGFEFLSVPIVQAIEYVEEPVKVRKTKSIKNELEVKFNELNHDDMVYRLIDIANNTYMELEVRKEASKRIRRHSITCEQCKDIELPLVGFGDTTEYTNRPIMDENGNLYENPADAAKKLGVYASNIRSVLIGKYNHTGGHRFTYASKSTSGQ